MKVIFSTVSIFCILFVSTINNSIGKNLFNNFSENSQNQITDFVSRSNELDKYYSTKKLGSFTENNKTFFRLFAPQALKVSLILFDEVESEIGNSFQMKKDIDGVWEYVFDSAIQKVYYGYKVKNNATDSYNKLPLCIDPYSKAVTSFTTYANPRKSIFWEEVYDWGGDTWIQRDWRDLTIYEMHIRDISIHQSSQIEKAGTYMGLTETGKTGGLDYIKNLGVNTVELLPAMDFGRIEIPFRDSAFGRFNTWNPYERNHWGYMTAAFFAPEPYYAENSKSLEWNTWIGKDGAQVKAFKDMVKSFHKEKIAVIMDVVFNHLSEYELGNLKEIDKEYYFRLDNQGDFIAASGCGNDLKTERPMVRRLIIESILFWMKEYHIDGFRFDLGRLIDWQTIEQIIFEARKINPNVIFVCEPWGGGWDPNGFSLRDWGSWNDQIRNGIKGENPHNGLGWIFGKWYGNNSRERIKSYLRGTLTKDNHGLFIKSHHSVNYLESHDGYTLGDFIRIGLKDADENSVFKDIDSFQLLTPQQLKLNKLSALFLFVSQGITMIHSGQEYARTKIIPADINVKDENKGKIDHNSYNKDNETNFINYNHAKANSELLNYYKGLIALRSKYEAFRRAEYSDISFSDIKNNEFAINCKIKYNNDEFLILLNADREKTQSFDLPDGKWQVIVTPDMVDINSERIAKNGITLNPSEGYVLKRK